MLFSLTIGFFVTATLENALIRRYFVRNSNHYRPVLQYFRKYWKLIFTNFFVYPWVIHSQFCVLDNGYADGDCKKFRM